MTKATWREWASKGLNGVLFYVIWFYCAWSVGQDQEMLGLASIGLFLIFHFTFSKNRAQEFLLLSATVVIGSCLDSLYITLEFLTYHAPNPWISWGAPLWVLAMYALFATTIDHALSWIQHTPIWMRALLGAGGGIASYVAGEKMHIVEFLLPLGQSIIIIGIVWALMFPLLYWLNQRLKVGNAAK